MGQIEAFDLLREITRLGGKRSIEDICHNIEELRLLKKMIKELTKDRLKEKEKKLEGYKEEKRKYEEELAYDALKDLLEGADIDELAEKMMNDRRIVELDETIESLEKTEPITKEDVERTLKKYEEEGYIGIERGEVKVTSRGADILAKGVLRRIAENFRKRGVGPHKTPQSAIYGSKTSTLTRQYDLGDDYESLAIEETLLNALTRAGKTDASSMHLSIEPRDLVIYKTIHQSKMCAGLLIDKSGSMGFEGKFNAAIEASLALSELLKENPEDSLRVFLFSDDVKQIQPWEIVNIECGGWTDIKSAMNAFRREVAGEDGDKHVYLITDSEPNYESGGFTGFNKAIPSVLEEALRYREDEITLNVIMLSWNPNLKKFASSLAKRNLGRVFFTSPYHLGEMVIEDYLSHKQV
jgi:Ca-activated chloride channel family protein